MTYPIEELERLLAHYKMLVRKSELLPKPNKQWKRATADYRKRRDELEEAITILKRIERNNSTDVLPAKGANDTSIRKH